MGTWVVEAFAAASASMSFGVRRERRYNA